MDGKSDSGTEVKTYSFCSYSSPNISAEYFLLFHLFLLAVKVETCLRKDTKIAPGTLL